jgi:membrane protease YdiL (CAAX protease family)
MIISKSPNRILLLLELFVLFIAVPTLLYFWASPVILPVLWIFGLFCWIFMFKDPKFDRENLWRASAVFPNILMVLIKFFILGGILHLSVYLLAPQYLFSLILERPLIWILVIFLYPLLSVYPQEIIYRTYFFHRYEQLFPNKLVFYTVNALLFGYMHIIFHNWVAVILTIIGGFLFALTYNRSRSTLLVSLEHSLFGLLIFTIGLGEFFYKGAV